MQSILERLVEGIEHAESQAELHELSFALRDHYGIAHVVYHWVSSTGEQYGVGTYPREWADHYTKMGYMRVDPVIQGCFQRFHPVEWKRLDWSSKAAKTIMAEAIDYGIGNQGYSIPLRGPNGQFALFTLNDSCSDEEWEAFTTANARDLMVLAHMFNQRALSFESGENGASPKALSPREVDALTYLALGYSRAQAADTLSISEHTLRVYVESARFKLGAMNTTHAVAKALARGLIVVSTLNDA